MKLLSPSPERERDRLEAERLRLDQEQLRAEARRRQEVEEAEHRVALARRNGVFAEEQQARETAEDHAHHERIRARLAERRAVWAERTRVAGRLAVMSITNLGVNLVAVAGQALSFVERGWPTSAATLAAAIIESVAVYVSWHAHVALREGDAAWQPRMTSYLIGAAAGYLSYTHVPQYPELFAVCSLASPWLWSMHSRHLHRQDLREKGLIDVRAPKFSFLRWVLHWRETFEAFRWAVAEGEQSPHTAVAVVRERRAVEGAGRAVRDAQSAVIAAQRTQLQLALTQLAALSQELYGLKPEAAKAMHNIARFIERVGTGVVPTYRPILVGALRPADEKSADGTDDVSVDGGRTADEEPMRERTDGADGDRRPRGPSTKKRTDERRTSMQPAGRMNGDRTNRTGGRTGGPNDLTPMLPLGRAILAQHHQNGIRLTRDRLAAAVKETGQTISNERAGALLHLLRTDDPDAQPKKGSDGRPSDADGADENGSSADDTGANR